MLDSDEIGTTIDGVVIGLMNVAGFILHDVAQVAALGLGAAYTIVRIRYYLVKTKQAKKEMRP